MRFTKNKRRKKKEEKEEKKLMDKLTWKGQWNHVHVLVRTFTWTWVIREDLFKFSKLVSFLPRWLLALSDSWNKYLAFLWYMSISVLYKSNQLDATSCDWVLDQREVITTAKDLFIFSVTFSWCCRYFSPRSLLHPSVSIHILYTFLFTFLMSLKRRICLAIGSFLNWWSFPSFS